MEESETVPQLPPPKLFIGRLFNDRKYGLCIQIDSSAATDEEADAEAVRLLRIHPGGLLIGRIQKRVTATVTAKVEEY